MIYVIAKGEVEGSVMLVKANDEEQIKKRLNLQEGEHIVGHLTSSESDALHSSSFTVVTA